MKTAFAYNDSKLWNGLPGSMKQAIICHPSNESYHRLATGISGVPFRCTVHRMSFYSYYFFAPPSK